MTFQPLPGPPLGLLPKLHRMVERRGHRKSRGVWGQWEHVLSSKVPPSASLSVCVSLLSLSRARALSMITVISPMYHYALPR